MKLSKEEIQFNSFLTSHTLKISKLIRSLNNAVWSAETTGDIKQYKELERLSNKLSAIYSDKKDYHYLQSIRQKIKDPMLKRQLELLILSYKPNQLPLDLLKEINKKESEVQRLFNTFRAKIDGKMVTTNQIIAVLKSSRDNKKRKKYWESQKTVGQLIAPKLLELVKLRNQAAKDQGYKNYYNMSLNLQELDPNWLLNMFNKLHKATENPFISAKKDIDSKLAHKFKIKTSDIMPWHYSDPFFQECPEIFKINFDSIYRRKNILRISKKFYNDLGLPISSILKRSDLYERKGKSPHAFCINMDHKGDVRILMNLKNDATNMSTLLHESGHGVYDLGISKKLPYLLRDVAHIFVTEGIAMLMGKLAYDHGFINRYVNRLNKRYNKESDKQKRYTQLILSGWFQVMVRFEKEMYAHPKKDLNKYWWRLVEKYQHVPNPERDLPDYASKIHLTTAPVYYHNYQLGEVFASQVNNHILSNQETFYHKNTGTYLKAKIFKPGALLPWNGLTRYATGKSLTPRYFIDDYCKN